MSKRRTLADIAREIETNALRFPSAMTSDWAYAVVSDRNWALIADYNAVAKLRNAPMYHELSRLGKGGRREGRLAH